MVTASLILLSAISPAQVDRTKAPPPGPSPVIQLGKYESFRLENGLTVFVVENHKLPRVSYRLQVDLDPLTEGENAGYVEMTGELMRRGTANRTKQQLDEEVDFIGADLSTWPGGMSGTSLKKHSATVLELMADILHHASFPADELDKLKKQKLSELAAERENPNAVSRNVSAVLMYGKNHPYGEIVTEKSVGNVTVEKCREFFTRFFRPNKAYLAVVGDITAAEVRPLIEQHFGSWQPSSEHSFSHKKPAPPVTTEVALVDRPGAVQSVISVCYPVNLRPGSPDVIKASVMNAILGGSGFSGRLMQNLREDKAYTYGSYSTLAHDKEVGAFSAFADVRNAVTDSAIMEILYEMKRLRDEPVPDDVLRLTLSKMAGSFARSLENPQAIANFALNKAMYNLPDNYYETYLQKLSAVTAEDVQQMAQKYILPERAYIVVVGSKADVKDKLGKFAGAGKVKLYDRQGHEEAEMRAAPAGVTAQTVMDRYILAVTGEKKMKKALKELAAVADVTMKMAMSMRGMDLELAVYRKAPGKYAMTLGNETMTMQEQIFDGQRGVGKGMQGRTEMEGDALNEMKYSSLLNPEPRYAELGFTLKLEGIEVINEKEYYRMEVTNPGGGTSTHYYSVETGLRHSVVSSRATQYGTVTQTTEYSDYREVDGILYPYRLRQNFGPQALDLTVTSVQVNTGMKDSVFSVE